MRYLPGRFFCVCERFEPRNNFKSGLSLIVRVNVVLNRTVVVDSRVIRDFKIQRRGRQRERQKKQTNNIYDPPQDFNAKGESTRTTRFHFKTKEFILTRFSTLAILPH